jgi:hypothetical protein
MDFNDSSLHKAIETPELLEHILSHLPPLELCHARLVSKMFRNVIDHSLVLQKNLFLVPSALTPSLNPESPFANCLLIDEHDFEIAQAPPAGWRTCRPEVRPSAHFHPILGFYPLELDGLPRNRKSDFTTNFTIHSIDYDVEDGAHYIGLKRCDLSKLTQTFDNPSGLPDDSPLHRMFLTNPPIKVLNLMMLIPFWKDEERWVDQDIVTKGNGTYGIHTLMSDTGITFGQLFEHMKEAMREQQKRVLPDPIPDYWADQVMIEEVIPDY